MWFPRCVPIRPSNPLCTLRFTLNVALKSNESPIEKMIVHRINGYIILILLAIGIAGAIMITRHAQGGAFSVQIASGALSILVAMCAVLAYINIKRLQIDQHRKWMLR